MGNKSGKFEVTKDEQVIKKENDVQQPEEAVVAEKVDQVESAPAAEPKENGDTEAKEEIVTLAEDKKEEAVVHDNDVKVETTETAETKKKGIMGWLKKISFRKEKKPTKASETEEKHETEKIIEVEEKKEEEAVAEKSETEKVEEAKVEDKSHEEEKKHEEVNEKTEE